MNHQTANPKMGTLQSFILADHVYMDVMTRKMIIAGTFDRLHAMQFPTQLSHKTFAYLRLTDFRDKHKLKICFIDLTDESVLMGSPEIEFENSSPNESNELIMEVPPFPMPHPGYFEFVVFCDGNRIGRIRMELAELEERSKE